MLAYRTPGVYFERPRSRPAIRRLRTDIAGFVGIARSGPLHHPVRVESWPEFVAVFGDHTPQGYLAYAVEGFFANRGRTCWIVRVADPARARPVDLDLLAGGSLAGRLVATSPGTWGRDLTVTAVGTARERFSLIIRKVDGGQELWRQLSTDRDDERYVGRVLNDATNGSRLLKLCPAVGPRSASQLTVTEGRIEMRRPAPDAGHDGLWNLTVEHFVGSGPLLDPFDPCSPQVQTDRPWGLRALEHVDEVSFVAMPDAMPRPQVDLQVPPPQTPRCDELEEEVVVPDESCPPTSVSPPLEFPAPFDADEVGRLQRALIAHCELLRDRVAILDVPPAGLGGGDVPEQVQAWRRNFSSRWAAAYFPWLRVPERLETADLLTRIPPSGHIAGVIARSDTRVGVHKPPANERLEGVEDLAAALDDVAHGNLNQAGINAIRVFPGRGIRVAGARTLDREPAHRYLNVRRLLIAIAEAIDEQTQWTVFEPNDPRLWRQIDRVVRAYLLGLWRDGMLDGATADEAFTVACDDTTNSAQDIEAGRLICEIGVLPPWPAEFVVVRIGISQGGVELIAESTSNGGAGSA